MRGCGEGTAGCGDSAGACDDGLLWRICTDLDEIGGDPKERKRGVGERENNNKRL